MINVTVKLWEEGSYKAADGSDFVPTLTTYVLDNSPEMDINRKRASILICPGGAYAFTSDREAEPVMMKFFSEGFNVFILRYSVAPAKHPQPLLDVSRAMWLIRQNAEAWHVDTGKIAVCGFSAGGHLAASLGVFWNEDYIKEAIGMPEGMNRPNALILAYPVITSGEYAHRGSFENLLGENATEEQLKSMSLELHVNEMTPPSFIWHTFNDEAVPVENSLLFAQSLRKQGIPFELHIYPDGPHGLSICSRETAPVPSMYNPHAASWIPLCIEWLKHVFEV